MTNSPIQPTGPNSARSVGEGITPAPARDRNSRVGGDNPSFQVLLERLQSKALELEQRSKSLEGPQDLARAVENARVSLEDAGSLGERLLEAYRQAQAQPGGDDPNHAPTEDRS